MRGTREAEDSQQTPELIAGIAVPPTRTLLDAVGEIAKVVPTKIPLPSNSGTIFDSFVTALPAIRKVMVSEDATLTKGELNTLSDVGSQIIIGFNIPGRRLGARVLNVITGGGIERAIRDRLPGVVSEYIHKWGAVVTALETEEQPRAAFMKDAARLLHTLETAREDRSTFDDVLVAELNKILRADRASYPFLGEMVVALRDSGVDIPKELPVDMKKWIGLIAPKLVEGLENVLPGSNHALSQRVGRLEQGAMEVGVNIAAGRKTTAQIPTILTSLRDVLPANGPQFKEAFHQFITPFQTKGTQSA